jgi:hypothetical protein
LPWPGACTAFIMNAVLSLLSRACDVLVVAVIFAAIG